MAVRRHDIAARLRTLAAIQQGTPIEAWSPEDRIALRAGAALLVDDAVEAEEDEPVPEAATPVPASGEQYWTGRDGRRLAVGTMEMHHCRNSLRLIIRAAIERGLDLPGVTLPQAPEVMPQPAFGDPPPPFPATWSLTTRLRVAQREQFDVLVMYHRRGGGSATARGRVRALNSLVVTIDRSAGGPLSLRTTQIADVARWVDLPAPAPVPEPEVEVMGEDDLSNLPPPAPPSPPPPPPPPPPRFPGRNAPGTPEYNAIFARLRLAASDREHITVRIFGGRTFSGQPETIRARPRRGGHAVTIGHTRIAVSVIQAVIA